ncbi:MAG TPA: thymidine kinase [Pyrinomonadaceae bacterium]|nr:thymidine kinase [Chloracidobacterium sp.]MBP9935859.1 thymidine kinase [Pyrinomonadaceae bacterium]MBK9437260.1 thymidine kinase [Chloracidobacterium sp.]MBL0239934.1 thymidine kinase [Chloracidobacterium sp.]HQX55754.1 thymidine kinase [Pyrinomonadaceae bacterium]
MVEEFAFDNTEERRKVRQNGTGWVEVIAGSMFSGKSEELIRRLTRARIARQRVQVFKPKIDARYSHEEIASHSGQTHDSTPVSTTAEMMAQVLDDTQVVGIDEGQFFDAAIIDAVNKLAAEGRRVIVAGLDQDYTGKPFDPMPQLLSIAEFITKTHAICVKCGATANYSQRTVESDARVEVGAADKYEARCRMCFIPHADSPTRHD